MVDCGYSIETTCSHSGVNNEITILATAYTLNTW